MVGKLRPPEGFQGKVHWNFASSRPRLTRPRPRFAQRATYLMATVDRDGRFRMDDVPAGNYSLNVRFDRDEAGHLGNHRVHVPPTEGDSLAQPVDLGTLTLEKP